MVNVPDHYYAGQPAASRVPLYRPVALLVIVRVHGYGPRSRFIRCANFALTVAGTQGEELSGDDLHRGSQGLLLRWRAAFARAICCNRARAVSRAIISSRHCCFSIAGCGASWVGTPAIVTLIRGPVAGLQGSSIALHVLMLCVMQFSMEGLSHGRSKLRKV